VSFHIIGLGQGMSDLPEHAHMKGVPGGYTPEEGTSLTVDERTRGMGGVKSSCGEENLVDLDSDPRYGGSDILVHEMAHCVMDVGLPPALRHEIRETHRRAVEERGLWTRADGSRAYAGSNASEYFAELTMWYFGSHGEYVRRADHQPSAGPGGLAQYDELGFALLTAIYSGTHPALLEEDALCALAEACTVVVNGCGLDEYNGTYVADGVADGVPCYRKPGSDCTIERGAWSGTSWGLGKNYGNFDYWLESTSALPPAAGWIVDKCGPAGGQGVPPAPSVEVVPASKSAVRVVAAGG